MSKKIKIMHIINNFQVGGAEKMLVLLLNTLAERPDIAVYAVSLEGHGPLVNELSDKVRVKEFKYSLFRPILSRLDPNFRFGLFNYVRNVRSDIIHGHLFKGEDFAKVMGALTGIPVVTTSHDTMIHPSVRAKFLNRFLSKAIAVSNVVAKHLADVYELPQYKITVIPNAIDTKLFETGKKKFNIKKPVFLYIGRLLESKGIDDAIKGLAMLRADYPQVQFLVYGREVHSSYKKYLDDLVRKNSYDFVKFMGRTDDVPEALRQGDILVLPSQTEGFAISVLEAAAASKPVIATRAGAIPEIVADGKSGILVDWKRPAQIYVAAKRILDENLVAMYGAEALKLASGQFDVSQVGQIYHDLYMGVVGS